MCNSGFGLIDALLDSASEFRNEGRRCKEEKGGGMSAFDKRAGRVSAHSLGRASCVLRSKRLKMGKWHTEGEREGHSKENCKSHGQR
jgi:hypothetical protein